MTADAALEYLHTHWVLPDQPTPPPAGPAWRQAVWKVAGRLTFGSLQAYLAEERTLLSRTVQVCDTLARRVDTLEGELEQLVAAIHRQLAELAADLDRAEAAFDARPLADGPSTADAGEDAGATVGDGPAAGESR